MTVSKGTILKSLKNIHSVRTLGKQLSAEEFIALTKNFMLVSTEKSNQEYKAAKEKEKLLSEQLSVLRSKAIKLDELVAYAEKVTTKPAKKADPKAKIKNKTKPKANSKPKTKTEKKPKIQAKPKTKAEIKLKANVKAKAKKASAKPKYEYVENGSTHYWNGNGRTPNFLKKAKARGEDIDQFLIEKNK